jgi:hypothetical protein
MSYPWLIERWACHEFLAARGDALLDGADLAFQRLEALLDLLRLPLHIGETGFLLLSGLLGGGGLPLRLRQRLLALAGLLLGRSDLGLQLRQGAGGPALLLEFGPQRGFSPLSWRTSARLSLAFPDWTMATMMAMTATAKRPSVKGRRSSEP